MPTNTMIWVGRKDTDSSRGVIGTGKAVGLLREEYPGVGEMLDGMGEYYTSRVQYEAVLVRTADGNTDKVDMVARYGQVEFRKPYGEAYIETRSVAKVRSEIRRLASEGYAVVHQTATLGITADEVHWPSR